MNAASAFVVADPDTVPHEVCCFHCGASCTGHARRAAIDGRTRDFCCDGCLSAARWIADSGLSAYYSLRESPANGAEKDARDAGPELASWDTEEVRAAHTREVRGGREITLLADGMHCAACGWLIDRALSREPGVLSAMANAVTGRIRLRWDPALRPLSQLLGVVARLGYTPYLAAGLRAEETRRRERNRWLLRTGIAGLASLQTMMFAEGLYLDAHGSMPLATRDFLRWIALLVSAPVVFYCGWPFLAGAWREITNRRLGMDMLVATSVLLAWVASVAETMRGGRQVWFDAVAMFVFLLLVGRFLEQRVRARSHARLDELARAQPSNALRRTASGGVESVPVSKLTPGDLCLVPAGRSAPADGILEGPDSSFNESLLTGEPLAVAHRAGDTLLAGAVCVKGPALLRIRRVGAETRLAGIVRLADAAQSERPPLARLADRVASGFVLALLSASLLAYVGWQAIDPSRAFDVALSLLVISCPCALSLAVPAALTAAQDALLRRGVLSMSGDALESLSGCTDVVLDKTGTLTLGRAELVSYESAPGAGDRDALLRLAAALARQSVHPQAAAIAAALPADSAPSALVSDPSERRGQGIEGLIDGRRLRLGTAPFATGAPLADDFLWLGDGEHPLCRFELRDRLRPESPEVIGRLIALGLTPHLLSGDGPPSVERCASVLGIADARARQTPEAKLAAVRALQGQGRRVVAVGDGINDAPVLAGADVAIAIAAGADLAQRASDLVWTRTTLHGLPDLFVLARRTQGVVRANFVWAIGYNAVAIPLALLGLVTPWVAAVAMVASSLTVTLNALRLARGPT